MSDNAIPAVSSRPRVAIAIAGVFNVAQVRSMNLEWGLCKIQSDSSYLHDERSFAVEVTTSPLWHTPNPDGRSRP
jgi:hypothetical protein